MDMEEERSSLDSRERVMVGLTVFLVSDSLVFLSLFVAYIVLRLQNQAWLPEGVAGLDLIQPAMNTAVLVSSSGVVLVAEQSLRRHHHRRFLLYWTLAIAMGLTFLVGQIMEWLRVDFSIHSGLFGASFFLLTGFHGLHVLTGLIVLMVILKHSFHARDDHDDHWGVSAAALLWHFVDGIWIILFILLYLWRP